MSQMDWTAAVQGGTVADSTERRVARTWEVETPEGLWSLSHCSRRCVLEKPDLHFVLGLMWVQRLTPYKILFFLHFYLNWHLLIRLSRARSLPFILQRPFSLIRTFVQGLFHMAPLINLSSHAIIIIFVYSFLSVFGRKKKKKKLISKMSS